MARPSAAAKKAARSRALALFQDHYTLPARYDGDALPKKHAAGLKRLASGLRGTGQSFRWMLTPEQARALAEAEAALVALAQDLDAVSALARDYRAGCAQAEGPGAPVAAKPGRLRVPAAGRRAKTSNGPA